jgi:hypothetical protein
MRLENINVCHSKFRGHASPSSAVCINRTMFQIWPAEEELERAKTRLLEEDSLRILLTTVN